MIDTWLLGVVLGLSAGLAPGPLLAFVISQTLKYNVKEGLKVALAPLITDVPIILVALFLLTKLSNFKMVLGIISFLGGAFILYLSYESIQTQPLEVEYQETKAHSFKKGAMVNALNPHPYLFWFSVGSPTMLKAQAESNLGAVAFVTSFYVCLVGSKICLALVVGKSRAFLEGHIYVYAMRVLGVLLFLFALLLFRDGLRLIGLSI
ncbi:MAG: LysE family translocator [Deltaproteobacteria bacterium]|jgi:threonine/homoserine/homoserine lactone efflux protein